MKYTNSQTLTCRKIKKNTGAVKSLITFDISEEEIRERKQRTTEFLGSLRLESIELDKKTLADINYFDGHGITPKNALAALYDELNRNYGTRNKIV